MKKRAAIVVTLLTIMSGVVAQESDYAIPPLEKPAHVAPAGVVALGRILFQDRRLSGDNTVSCAHCHPLDRGGADGLPVSVGVKGRMGAVNAPTVYNIAGYIAYFWDGRAATLEELILDGPLQNPDEMNASWEEVLGKLRKDPVLDERFHRYFTQGITPRTVSRAIAAFLRTLVTLDSPFDRWEKGDPKALSDAAVRGYKLFSSYGCIACHQGRAVGGNMFATMGVMGDYFRDRNGGVTQADLGRFNVTGKASDKYVFKVPSLRLAAVTPPYFHDGSVATLDEAVRIMGRYQLGREIPPVDRADIIAFLRSLVGRHPMLKVQP